jgi:hypothetical protein
MQAEYALENRTDWTDIFCQLMSFQVPDPLFSAANFSRIPVKLLGDVLNYNYMAMQKRTNAASVSTAKLTMAVYSALGTKGNKHKIDHFLPFELDQDDSVMKKSTKEAMQWALKHEKMPPTIVGMLGAELR